MAIQVKKDIISSGFIPKAEKSMWTPTKNLTFLGTNIDTDKGVFTIPDNRIDKIMSTISDIDLCLTKNGKSICKEGSFLGVDAFTVDWRGINGLFVPPVSLIPRALMYMRQCKAVGTLILPYWPSASYWPMLCPFGDGFISEVTNFIDLPTYKNAYIAELLSESRAVSTTKGYYHSFLRWKNWATLNGIENGDILPTKAFHVAIYLASLTQSSNTVSPVVQAFYSLKWIHSLIGSSCSPTDSSLVINVLEGAKRSLATPTNKKEPISVELLHKMYDAMFSFGNLYNQRIICACFTAFAGFLRVSELLNIRRSDIVVLECYMSILIQHSKTDVYRDGNSVLIARTHSNKCPVKNMELYLLWAEI
ncbi:unnamed protein product [Mytilus coruscus]|uniref:Core-binding (CB) domain-containing protein n=1 Tax=Mytilus coruscus TaxID=42192 RepID=A0A6J8BNS8_MYTCO|nr:unnamed protein product [Mytilus coruscus]